MTPQESWLGNYHLFCIIFLMYYLGLLKDSAVSSWNHDLVSWVQVMQLVLWRIPSQEFHPTSVTKLVATLVQLFRQLFPWRSFLVHWLTLFSWILPVFSVFWIWTSSVFVSGPKLFESARISLTHIRTPYWVLWRMLGSPKWSLQKLHVIAITWPSLAPKTGST